MSKVHKFHRMNTEEYRQELLDLAKSFRSKPVNPKDPVLGPKKQVMPPTSDYQAKVQEYLKRKGEKKSAFSGLKNFFKKSNNKPEDRDSSNSLDQDTDKTADMQKMSRPRITFPNFPEITNRPDQNVRTLENERQKKIYGRQVANAEFRDRDPNFKRPTRLAGGRKSITSKDQLIDEYGKRITGKFGRNVLGLSHNTPQGPKSAALAGKLRSKFEEGDEADQAKMDAHKAKVAEARQKYESDIKTWKEKADQLPRGSTEYWAHIGSRPKYKAPRRPAKSLKDTKELSPEKMALRGKTVDSTIEHEGFHDLMAHIENKYGPVASGKVVRDLISQHHPEAIEAVDSFVRHAMGYKRNAPRYNEELITHARDILVNPTKRERFKKFLADSVHGRALVSSTNPDREAVFKEMISHLKRGHQKAYERAKQIKLADIRPDLAEQPQKMAASEQARIQQTNTSWKFPQRPKKAPKAKFMSIEGENPQIAEPSKSGSPALNKGAARRLHGKIDPLKMPDREKIKEWQTSTGFLQELDSSYDEEQHRGVREELPEMGSGTKHRALNKLSSKTLTRRHPQTGERQFLLFRGIGQDENHTVYPKHIHNTESSSWTPHLHVAKGFESDRTDDYNEGKTIAAWVNEGDIHLSPTMYGNIPDLKMDMDDGAKFYVPDKRKAGQNEFALEHEIVVRPHKSMRATKADVQRYQTIHNPTRTKISTSDPKKDLNARINYRGEQQQVRPSTKEYPIIRMTKPIPSAVLEAAGMGMKKPKKMAASEMEKNESADKETQKIKENQQKPEAKKPHNFKAAEWTHPNGHPRCIICGDEERVGGMCEGLNE